MPWGWAAAATIGGALISSSAAKSAANTQAAASNQAAVVQQQMYDTTRGDLAPYMGAGNNALLALLQSMGFNLGNVGASTGAPGSQGTPNADGTFNLPTAGAPGGTASGGASPLSFDPSNSLLLKPQANYTPSQSPFSFASFTNPNGGPLNIGAYNTPSPLASPGALASPGTLTAPAPFSFNPSDLSSTPGYQFQLSEGLNAVQNQAAKGGGALGGDSLREMQRYAQGVAGSTYNTAFGQAAQAYDINATTPLNYFRTGADVANQNYLTNASVANQNYLTNAGTQLAGYNANKDTTLQNYNTNFDTSLATYGTNQSNALTSWLQNNNFDLTNFTTNANVDQNNKSQLSTMLQYLISGGANAAAGVGQAGSAAAGNIGNAYTGAANAAAAGTVGSANAISGGVNSLSQMFMMSKMFPGMFGGAH